MEIVFFSCFAQQIPETRTIHCVDMQNTGFIRTDFLASLKPLQYALKLTGLTPFDFPDRCGGKTSSNKVCTVTSPWNIAHSLVLTLGLSCVFAPHLKFHKYAHPWQLELLVRNFWISDLGLSVHCQHSVTLSASYILSWGIESAFLNNCRHWQSLAKKILQCCV